MPDSREIHIAGGSSFLGRLLAAIEGRFGLHIGELVSGAAITLVLRLSSTGLMFGFNILAARLLGVSETGLYFLALATLNVGCVIARAGLDGAALRFISAHAENKEWGIVGAIYERTTALSFSFALLAAATLFTFSPIMARHFFHKPEMTEQLMAVSFSLPAFSLLLIHVECLKGLKRIFASQALQGLILPVVALFTLFLVGSRWGATGAVLAYTAGIYFSLFAARQIWRRLVRARPARHLFKTRDLLKVAGPIGAIMVTNLVIQWLPLLVLGAFGTSADVGVFGASLRIATLIGLVLVAVNSIAAPKFAALWARREHRALEKVAVYSAVLVMGAAAPMLLLLIFFPSLALSLFGRDFSVGAPALQILALGQFVNAATGSVGFLLMMTGNERLLWRSVTIAALVCVAMSAFIAGAGTDALAVAALAVALPLAMQNILATIYAWRTLRIMPCNFFILLGKGGG